MPFILIDLLIVAALFVAMLGTQEVGRYFGNRDRRMDENPDADKAGSTSAAEGATYALLGLLIAFVFSGAGGRYERRYELVVEETNDIGTAWLRLDALPAGSQPHLRELFREYVDARIETARNMHTPAEDTMRERSVALQREIWSATMAALQASGQAPLYGPVMQPINDMIDITSTRLASRQLHPPIEVFVMLGVLTIIASLYAGYSAAGKRRIWIHSLGFPVVLAMALFVILDFELPRFGLIRLDNVDSMLIDLRHSME
jgi:hypothetical protein